MIVEIFLIVLSGIVGLMIIAFGVLTSCNRYSGSNETVTVSSLGQSGIKVGLLGICSTDETIAGPGELDNCDTGMQCDVYDTTAKLGICRKAIGTRCSDIYECTDAAKICIKSNYFSSLIADDILVDVKTCQVNATGGIGQPPGINGCDPGNILVDDLTGQTSGVCLADNGQTCNSDVVCASGSCFNDICTARKAIGQKCLRDNNCIATAGCNTNYENLGINNDFTKICIDSTSKETLLPRTVCISNGQCNSFSNAECSPPYGVCQAKNIPARAIGSQCNVDHPETCNTELGCAVATLNSNGLCQSLLRYWPSLNNCGSNGIPGLVCPNAVDCLGTVTNPISGMACPRPMQCSGHLGLSVPGCVFYPDYGCSLINGCIFGHCDGAKCVTSTTDITLPNGLIIPKDDPTPNMFKHWNWNPIVNGMVIKWDYTPKTIPSNYFDGNPVLPALTNSSEMFRVLVKEVDSDILYTFFQTTVATTGDSDIYFQVNDGNFTKIQVTVDGTGIPSFTSNVVSCFPYLEDSMSFVVPKLGFNLFVTGNGSYGFVLLAVPFREDGVYSLTVNNVPLNPTTTPTRISKVHCYRNRLEYVNIGLTLTATKARTSTCFTTVSGSTIEITPNNDNIDLTDGTLDLQRWYGFANSVPVSDDHLYYLKDDFSLIRRVTVGDPGSENVISVNVDCMSVDQNTGAVWYVTKDDSAIPVLYKLKSYLDGNYYDVPFPLGSNSLSVGNLTIVKHLLSHYAHNGTAFTGDMVLHTDTRVLV